MCPTDRQYGGFNLLQRLQVALVYPNSDPGMFWVAFFGCLLAEVIPVPIEVPLSRKVRKPLCEHR